jgi:hypothetical protein
VWQSAQLAEIPAWLIFAGMKLAKLWQVEHGWAEGKCPAGIGIIEPGGSLNVVDTVWHETQGKVVFI